MISELSIVISGVEVTHFNAEMCIENGFVKVVKTDTTIYYNRDNIDKMRILE